LGILIIVGRLSIWIGGTCRRLGLACTSRCSVATIASTVAVALASVTVATIATLAAVATVTVSWSATSIAISVAAIAVRHWAVLVCFVIILYLPEKLVAKMLGFVYALLSGTPKIVRIMSRVQVIDLRNVEVHWLLAFLAGLGLHEA
jgi:hypothetical protein